MTTESSQEQLNDADVVRAAATRSLAAPGVRLYRVRTREAAGGGWSDPWSWEIGVADPAARSVQLRHFHSEDSPVEKLAEAAARKWPWLDDDAPPSEPGPRTGEETIEIGRTQFCGGPDRWIDWSDMPFYGPARAMWPLEALLGTTTTTRAASTDVRGDACARYVSDVVPGEVARLEGITLVDPPEPGDDWRALSAEVSIDARGHVRRIAWSPTTGRRFKPGLLPRLAGRLDRKAAVDHAFDASGRLWYITEFWDYGCDVEISVPTNLIDMSDTSMRDIIKDLWQMRRRYKQEDPRRRRRRRRAP
jgi:hypothetical protein